MGQARENVLKGDVTFSTFFLWGTNMRGMVAPMDNRKISARIDLKKASQVGDVALGDDVVVVIKGKVTSLRGPDESLYTDSKGKEHKDSFPGSMEIELGNMEINPEGKFDGLLED